MIQSYATYQFHAGRPGDVPFSVAVVCFIYSSAVSAAANRAAC